MRHVLIFLYLQKKKAAESYRIILDTYGDKTISQKTCERWFDRFKNGNFNVKDNDHPGQPKKFEDAVLQALLDEDDRQTQKQLADALNISQQAISKRLRAMGKIQKEGKWIPYELNERNKQKRKTSCGILLEKHRRKSFLHRIVTGDEKWIYFENQKRRKSWCDPGQPSSSIAKRNIHGKKALLCIWWDQKGVLYYELLQPGQTITGDRYQQQLLMLRDELQEKRPEWAKRHGKVILLHDNARPHVSKQVKETLDDFSWDVLPHPPYLPDIAPSDYYLFRSMAHCLSEQRFKNFEDVKFWIDEWIISKHEKFFFDGIHKLPEKWAAVVDSEGNYFD